MKRQIRLVILVIMISVVLFAAILILDSTEKQHEITEYIFKNVSPGDVRTVSISNSYGNIYVDYLEGGYLVGNLPVEVVDMERFVDMMTDSGALHAEMSVKNADGSSKYGLDSEAATVDIAYQDGDSIRLHIGSYEPISKGYYCSIDGDEEIYLFDKEQVNGYLQPEKYYINTYITPEIPEQSQSSLGHVLGVEMSGGQLTEKVTLQPVMTEDEQSMLDVISFGSATHLIEINGLKHRVDQKYATTIFDSLTGLKAEDIVDYNLTKDEIDAFGFSSPDMRVVFDFLWVMGADVHEYDISIIEKSGSYYGSCNQRGIIYKIKQPVFYTAELQKFPVRWFFSPLLFDLKELEIDVNGQKYIFEVSGTTISDLAVALNGESFDLDRFRQLYKLVTSAAHDNEMTDKVQTNDEALMTITYRYRNVEKDDDVIKLYVAGDRRHYVEANGVTEYTMKESFYTRLVEALNVIWTDDDFEIDW